MRAVAITNIPRLEDVSPALANLMKKLGAAEKTHQKAQRDIAQIRQDTREFIPPGSPLERRRVDITATREKRTARLLKEAGARRGAAANEIAEINTQIVNAKRQAELTICAQYTDTFNRTLATYWSARLARQEAEISALADLVAIRDHLSSSGIRLPAGAFAWSSDYTAAAETADAIRAEVAALVQAGAITATAIPAGLRKQWRLG